MKSETDGESKELELEILELDKRIRQIPPAELAYKIITLFYKIEDPDEQLRALFIEWFFDRHNCEAKDQALKRTFNEIFIKHSEPSGYAKESLRQMQIRMGKPKLC